MGNLKKMIFGEKMPDKDDPDYREKYEKDVEAGRKFARATRLDRLAGHVQRFAERNRVLFLSVVMAIILGCFAVNAVHFSRAVRYRKQSKTQDPAELIRESIGNAHTMIPIPQEDGKETED